MRLLSRPPARYVGIFFCTIGLLLFVVWISSPHTREEAAYPELKELAGRDGAAISFSALADYFTALAKKKGAAYAFVVLKDARLPPDTDLHLLGHAVGDVLFKQQGLDGIKICTEDFRNACSHSIVIGLLLERGESALPQIAKACRKAPGGSGAYTMCYHGLGHGVLAFAGYDFTRAISLCEKTGTAGEPPQCIGGAVMEIIGGGGHNREQWARERSRFLTPDDPLSICTSRTMPPDGRVLCLIYLTPYLWEAVGADLGNPSDADFVKSFTLCERLPEADRAGRDACFGGFGKEFIALANNRDIRSVDQMSNQQYRRIVDWCALAPNRDARSSCLLSTMNSLYWGGENNRAGAINFCAVISDKDQQQSCFKNLIQSVRTYRDDAEYRQEFCTEIPRIYQELCATTL